MISIPPWMPPWLWERGIGAEADAVAGILAGIAENIRTAVALFAKGYHSFDTCFVSLGIAVFRLSFLF